jgi:hypothetical protein
MDRFSKFNALASIESYYLPRPHEECLGKQQDAFERAKHETLENLKKKIADIEEITFSDFVNRKSAA